MISLRPATVLDVNSLAPRLRKADISELLAASGSTPESCLKRGILESSECHVIVDLQDKPLAILGVVSASPFGRVWMVCSDEIVTAHKTEFLKKSRVVVDWLVLRHGPLGNLVDSRNTLHIRWIKWCGFKFPKVAPQRLVDPTVDFLLFYRN